MVFLDASAVSYTDRGAFGEENGRRFFVGEVAEFVTDKETLDILAGIEVDCVQGQLIGMPAPVVA